MQNNPSNEKLTNDKQKSQVIRKSPMTEDDLELYKFRIKCKFRAIVRKVYNNAPWLKRDEHEELKINEHIQEADVVAVLKEISEIKGFLTIYEKSLLCKDRKMRTEEDKRHLYRVICGIKYFKNFSNAIRRELAARAMFLYVGAGRMIIRKGHEASALYFVASGEVRSASEGGGEEGSPEPDFVVKQGGLFGEVALLNDILRTMSIIATIPCELVYISKQDFKEVLEAPMKQEWNKVEAAITSFTYFTPFDMIAKREACLFGKIKNFKPSETILGDGVGMPNYVYFILKGQCQLIESILISTTKQGKKHFYKLLELKANKSNDEDNKFHKLTNKKSVTPRKSVYISDDQELLQLTNDRLKEINENLSNSSEKSFEPRFEEMKEYEANKSFQEMAVLKDCVIPSKSSQTLSKSSTEGTLTKNVEKHKKRCFNNLPKNSEIHFMQVCLMNPGGCFNLGEKMEVNRRMVAADSVECLLLPKYWLWKHNPANIWSRVQHFLESKIPSTEKIFEEFVLNKKWKDYQKMLIGDILRDKTAVNVTTIHDVPYSVRIKDDTDFRFK